MAGTMKILGGDREEQQEVSMESGLDGRNNVLEKTLLRVWNGCLNGVRPRWPEQSFLWLCA